MIRFENGYVLYALLLIPVLIGLYVYIRYGYQKKLRKYGDISLLKLLMPDTSPTMQHLKFSLICLIWLFLVFALANPQMGSGVEKGKRKGIDIMFCIDVSNSMLAQDYAPNRLEAAKRALLLFVDQLKGDRIGIVVFAGNAFVQLPITSDYAAAMMFISNISTQTVASQGTDVATAIDKAAASMNPPEDKSGVLANQTKTQKVIVVISDGEDHFNEAVDVAAAVAKQGMLVYTIGVGNSIGEPVPVRTSSGRTDYKKDKDGNTVISRLNEQLLRDVAHAGKGSYIHANNAHVGFDILHSELEKIDKTEIEEVVFSRYESKYAVPLWIAFVLLIIEIMLYNKKMFHIRKLAWLKGNPKLPALLLLLLGLYPSILCGQTTQEIKALRQGNKNYSAASRLEKEANDLSAKNRESNQKEIAVKKQQAQQLYEQASTNYLKSKESTGNYYKSLYNQAAALYKQGKYEQAANEITQMIENTPLDDKTKAKAYHNLGNSLMQQGKYQESIDAYKRSLKANPSDWDTKYNLEYAKQKLQVQQQQQQQQQQNQNKEGDKNEQQQQQQQQQRDQQNKDNQQQRQASSAENKERQDDAKRKLDALQMNERKTQEKANRLENQQTRSSKQEKDW
ncbi:MAG: VWA domain-containing protein [Bacteroidales bacterium]|nr:VWA domain-containing protein [Bacteroidales bacterium]